MISTDDWVERLIDRYDAKLLVVENFAKLVQVDDWNDYGIVTAALRPYDAIASVTGCAIIIGLHVRKSGGEDGTSVMGSTQWVGGPSTIFTLERDGKQRTLSTMQREGDQMEKTMLAWDGESKTYSLGRTKWEAQTEVLQEEILTFLTDTDPADAGRIADGIGRKRQSVTRVLKLMTDQGSLTKTGKGVSGDAFCYARNTEAPPPRPPPPAPPPPASSEPVPNQFPTASPPVPHKDGEVVRSTVRPTVRSTKLHFDFEQFKAIYPKRSGSQPWAKSVKAANARVKEGATFLVMIDGARRYAEFCDEAGKTGTEYVMHAATFLGPDEHYLEPWTPPATKAEALAASNRQAAVDFLERNDDDKEKLGWPGFLR